MRIKQLLIAVCIGTMFVACSSKDDFSIADDNVIKLSAHIDEMKTRVAGNRSIHSNRFDLGEEVRVYIKQHGTANDVTGIGTGGYSIYTYGKTGFTSTDSPMFPQSNGVDVTAVYPSDVATSGSFTISTSQTTEEEYRKSDLMSAYVENHQKSNGAVELSFKHLLSKVIIKINAGNSGINTNEIVNADMYVPHITTPISWNQTTGWSLGEITESAGTNDIVIGGDNYTSEGYSAILIPETIPAGYEFLCIGVGGNLYSYFNSDPIELKPGCVHTFTFTIVNDKVKLSNFSTIDSWGSGGSESFDIEPL